MLSFMEIETRFVFILCFGVPISITSARVDSKILGPVVQNPISANPGLTLNKTIELTQD